jgi:hypothetical protein
MPDQHDVHALLRPLTHHEVAGEDIIPRYVPLGMSVTLVGEQAMGKSLLADDLTIRMATGTSLGLTPVRRGVVVILDAENPEEQQLRPRLRVAAEQLGFQLDDLIEAGQIKVVEQDYFRSFPQDGERLADELRYLRSSISEECAILLRVDPITAFLGPAKSDRVEDIRSIHKQLARLGSEINMTTLFITHPTKNRKVASPLDLILGSGAQGHASRAVLMVCRDPRDPELHYLWCEKNSNALPGEPLAYRIEGVDVDIKNSHGDPVTKSIGHIIWSGELAPSRAELGDFLLGLYYDREETFSKRDRAAAAYIGVLSARGPLPSVVADQEVAARLGESPSAGTINRARELAGVLSAKGPDGRHFVWLDGVHKKADALRMITEDGEVDRS